MAEVFLKVVNMSISAGWLVLAVWLVRFVMKKAPRWVSVLLWGMVAVRLVCPFSLESVLSLIPSAETISPDIMMDPSPTIHSGVLILNNSVNPIISEVFTPDPGASANPLQIWIPVASVIWIVGTVLMLIYAAVSCFRLHRRISTAVRLQDNIYQSEYAEFPFVMGIFRPVIYLPFTLGGKELTYVIAHEQAHIRRRDYWWKPVGFLLLSVYWFNPLMWAAYVFLCRDIELACDEKVIKELGREQRADYSQALLSCSVKRSMITACPLAFGEVGVKMRVRRVLSYKKPALWAAAAAGVLCVIMAVCFLTDPVKRVEAAGVNGDSESGRELELTEIMMIPIKHYVFEESEDFMKPAVTLMEDGRFSFMFSMISSYIGIGTYEIKDDRLTLHTDDGKFVYVFDIVEDTIVFDAEASSELVWFSGLYDGAVMR